MINISMWIKALKVMPRVSKDEWQKLDIVSRYLIMSRSAVFIMTFISGVVGGLLAMTAGSVNYINLIVAVIGLVFAHASNNLINDYTDYKKGIDNNNYFRTLYGPQPLASGLMTVKQLMFYIVFSLLMAGGAGLYLFFVTDMTTLYFSLAGLFFVLFYTWPLKYIGLGELAVIMVWGPLMIGGTYLVSSENYSLDWLIKISLISLSYAIAPTTVLFGKHIDKLLEDKKKKVFTMPVILGESLARWSVILLWVIQYVLVGYLLLTKDFGLSMLVVFLSFPSFIQGVKTFSKVRPLEEPKTLPKNIWPLYLSAQAFSFTRIYGMLFLLGLISDLIISKFF